MSGESGDMASNGACAPSAVPPLVQSTKLLHGNMDGLAATLIELTGTESVFIVQSSVTSSSSCNVVSEVVQVLPSYRQKLTLRLQPSLDLIAPDAYIRYLDKNGQSIHGGSIERSGHQVFKGVVLLLAGGEKLEVGWARIYVIRHGTGPLFEGTLTVYDEQYNVKLHSTSSEMTRGIDRLGLRHLGPRQDDHIIAYKTTDGDYTESKRSQDESICRVNSSLASTYTDIKTGGINGSLFKRQRGSPQYDNFRDHIGGTAGCPTSRRTASIGIVTDCTYTASFSSADAAHRNIVNVVNSASEVFERNFNISLQIQNITISDAECPSTAPENAPWNMPCATSDLQERLNLFSSWRGSISDDLAYWTLMTSCPTEGEVGVAWVGQLCNSGSSRSSSQSGTGAGVVVRTSTEWQVFAHESGHIFGAVHDFMSPSLETMSSGLLKLVVSYLDCPDIAALRLTCRNIKILVSQGRFTTFFKQHNILLETHILQALAPWKLEKTDEKTEKAKADAEEHTRLLTEAFRNIKQRSPLGHLTIMRLRVAIRSDDGALAAPEESRFGLWPRIWDTAQHTFRRTMRALEAAQLVVDSESDLFCGNIRGCLRSDIFMANLTTFPWTAIFGSLKALKVNMSSPHRASTTYQLPDKDNYNEWSTHDEDPHVESEEVLSSLPSALLELYDAWVGQYSDNFKKRCEDTQEYAANVFSAISEEVAWNVTGYL
ncbi:hypothetical protein ATEG_03965 [Paecilomyces variotii No. 5]|uniref:F-box domain-containing protein n=1 Tax=Byssochlamys spectabilis (strain No. 5 / NBRC 109023) TaxID=1356009 RepID=V5FML0_BYSSN|nr:hypothetical protein ATEG_03965 [Paecilomyces variotii No. 5]